LGDPTPVVTPYCFECKHFLGEKGAGYHCAAFSDRIPNKILLVEFDHSKPYPGDRGIRFERRPNLSIPTG
jgi:hypothetical protein